MKNVPTNCDDIIDSRDIIARIEELESERADLVQDLESANGDDGETEAEEAANAREALERWDEDNAEELRGLKSFAEQAEGYASDWHGGATLIADSYFKEYAQQYADDIGAINSDARWPANCIDWDQAAAELQQDYSAVEFNGATYWMR